MNTTDTLHEHTRLYLQFLQNVITRHNTNSFQIKTISCTLIGGFIAFMYEKGKELEPYASIALLILVLFFWVLDAYFLSYERKFRYIYDNVTQKIREETLQMKDLYGMNIGRVQSSSCSLPEALFSCTLIIFYGALIFLLGATLFFKFKEFNFEHIWIFIGIIAIAVLIFFAICKCKKKLMKSYRRLKLKILKFCNKNRQNFKGKF